MSETITALPSLANTCLLIAHAQKADVVWTKSDFIRLCEHMMNGNPAHHFMKVYRDKTTEKPRFTYGSAKFNNRSDRRVNWAWESIAGRAKSPAGIGFYPSNPAKTSRWAAMDFDAHNGEAQRARELAFSAFCYLRKQPDLFLVLGTSGSDGWHLFAFSENLHPVESWIRLLKQTAAFAGAEVKSGICEIFPNESSLSRAVGNGIRAPGTWNPKHDTFGLIAYQDVEALLKRGEVERESVYTHRETPEGKRCEFPYRGKNDIWRKKFAILELRTRREKLKVLVSEIFQQVGRETAKANAELQFLEKQVATNANAEEHATEFSELWAWMNGEWLAELTANELERYKQLSTDNERDAFRIVRGFSKMAEAKGAADFGLDCNHLAKCLGITRPGAGKIRIKFASLAIVEKTDDYVLHKSATRFRWVASIDQPF